MEQINLLSTHLKTRLVDLKRVKQQGGKIVGYFPGGYLPEELVLASGATPIGLIRGGDHSVVELAGAYICRWVDTFCRAQIGYGVSKEDPYYGITDLLVIPMTDNHVRGLWNVLAYNTDLETFPFGVPHTKDKTTLDYYLHGITRLKTKLEDLTGVRITESNLRNAITLCNRERELLREISRMRMSKPTPISSRDFVFLNHGSCLADKEYILKILENLLRDLRVQSPPPERGPRLLLTGSTLALGDHKIHDLVEEAGGVIVMEEFAEGLKPYWVNVTLDSSLMDSLADAYFMQRVPPAWFRPGGERLSYLIKQAREYNVSGVIWYQLMYREAYKTESYYFPELLKRETGLPMLVVESDYDASEIGPLRTRIETFIETARMAGGGKK